MSRTTRAEFARSELLDSISRANAVPIEAAGSAAEVADRVRQGKALLKIVSTPWGVEFYIVGVGETK
jgi:hypothetical protein